MTTEKQTAEQPAATDALGQDSTSSGQAPTAADAVVKEGSPAPPPGPDASSESTPATNVADSAGVAEPSAAGKPSEAANASEPSADAASSTPPEAESPGTETTTQADTPTDEPVTETPKPVAETSADDTSQQEQPTSESPSETPSDATAPAQRRVRLNPTVSPEVARAIPSVPPSEVPPGTQTTDEASPEQASTAADETDSQVDDIMSDEAVTSPTSNDPPPRSADPVALPSKNESLDTSLEAELEAAMAGQGQQSAPPVEIPEGAEEESAAGLAPDAEINRGMRLTGTVASIHGDDMFLDFGLRLPGVLSRRQFGLRKQPMQGETLKVVVGRIDENEGLIHVNLPTGTSKVRGDWDALVVDQNVECQVTGTNKGGLEVSIGALRGFMPASQVDLGFVPDLAVYVGQKLNARIAEVNPKRRKLVLSRRVILEEEREQSQVELFEKIEPGQRYTGRVRTLKDYGAFVDIGGADGLLHVAQISWGRINHPSEVLSEGEEIEVQVLSVDKDKKKISLGMRQLTQNPWKAAAAKFAQGAQIKGKVTRIENFGAFVELDEGVEGLVHISELDHKRVNKVGDVLRIGQEVDVQVLEVDPKRKRVGLSLKALKEKPEDPQEQADSEPVKRQRSVDSLVGGMGKPTGGQLFGDPNKFGG